MQWRRQMQATVAADVAAAGGRGGVDVGQRRAVAAVLTLVVVVARRQ